jgi:hypothetical protein
LLAHVSELISVARDSFQLCDGKYDHHLHGGG